MSKRPKDAKPPKKIRKEYVEAINQKRKARADNEKMTALSDSITAEYQKADSIYRKTGDTQGPGLPDDLPKVKKMEARLDSMRTAARSAKKNPNKKK